MGAPFIFVIGAWVVMGGILYPITAITEVVADLLLKIINIFESLFLNMFWLKNK